MTFLKNNLKNILVFVLVLSAGYFAYGYLSGEDESGPALEAVSGASPEGAVGRDLLVLLATLNTITLDESIFDDPAFKNLKNFRVEIAAQPVGRTNPFAPLSGGSNPKSGGVEIIDFVTE